MGAATGNSALAGSPNQHTPKPSSTSNQPRQQQRRQQPTPNHYQANGLSTSAADVTMATQAPRSNGIHTHLGGPELSKMQRPRSPLTLNQRSNTHTGHETPDARPSSAPGDNHKQDMGPGGFAHHRNPGQGSNGQPRRQQPKPLLLRTRSEFGVRPNDSDQSDEEIPQWGARHGFDELYESQQFMDKLANVSLNLSTCLSRAAHLNGHILRPCQSLRAPESKYDYYLRVASGANEAWLSRFHGNAGFTMS